MSDYGVSPSGESATNGEVGASDYTHDDMMRVLHPDNWPDWIWADLQPIVAHIERLEAEKRWLAQRLAGFRYQTRDDLVPTEDKAIANWLAAAQEAVRYE